VQAAGQIPQGIRIPPEWILTAPFDQVLLPALFWIDGVLAVPSLLWLPLIGALVLVFAASPLLRQRHSALVLCSPVAVTVIALCLARAYVLPRYMSFLLVPMFIMLSSGASGLLTRKTRRPPIARVAGALVVVTLLVGRFVAIAPDVVLLPREANRDAAGVVELRTKATTQIYASVRDPFRLGFYLDRPFTVLKAREVIDRVCGSNRLLVYVAEPWAMPAVEVPCLQRPGVEHFRFRQYSRGHEMNVWLVPPSS
jgi:hypothetical protein